MSNLPAVNTETSQTDYNNSQLVSFELEDEEYGIDVLAVREIIRMPAITMMPNTPDYIVGIINLRGIVVPIVSLRTRFGLFERENDGNSRILVVEVGNSLIGFVVDAVSEVIRTSADEIQPPPSIVQGNAVQDYITGVIHHNKRLLIVLDFNRLISDNEKAVIDSLE